MAKYWEGALKRALIVENPSRDLDRYLQDAGVQIQRLDKTPNESELIDAIQSFGAQVLFKRSRVAVSRKVVESCPTLFAIQLCCIGDDSIDKEACAEHGIMIFNDPVSNGRSVVELVIGNLIALARRLYETNVECRNGVWGKNNHQRYEILGKNLCVLGLGNIGRSVARAAQSLGMNILFYDTRQVSVELGKELGWTHIESLERLFKQADFLTVHLSAKDIKGITNKGVLIPDLFTLLGQDRFNSPKVFINFSRGFLHEPEALIQAVHDGHIHRAAVDVYPKEPRRGEQWENPYANCDRIVVFPHIGASTQEAQPRIAKRVSETFLSFSQWGGIRDTPFRVRKFLGLSERPKKGEVLLVVLHSTARGTKRAIDEAIYEAGISNLASVHSDFNEYGFAYDLARLESELPLTAIQNIERRAKDLTGEENAIHSIRQIIIS